MPSRQLIALISLVMSPLALHSQERVASSDVAARASIVADSGTASPLPSDTQRIPRSDAPAFREWESLTGEWSGVRTSLVDRGVTFGATYTHDASSVLSGGARRGSASRGLFMGEMSVDLSQAHLKGTTAFVSYAAMRGSNGSDLAGDIQSFSNVDADPFGHVYEAWIEQVAANGAIRLKVGRVDANTEYAVVAPAGEFINASAGFSPTILGLPTYPDPEASVNLFITPASWLTISAGAFAGTFDPGTMGATRVQDRFSIGEIATGWDHVGNAGAGKLAVGAWHHSGMAARFDGGFTKGADGWWASAEQCVSGQDASDDTPATGIQLFGKYGAAPEMLSVFRQHVMAGFVFNGGFRSGSPDALGLAFTHVDLSGIADAATPLDETSVEFFYRVNVLGSVTLRPNVQYVVHPSGDPTRANAVVATLRTAIAF